MASKKIFSRIIKKTTIATLIAVVLFSSLAAIPVSVFAAPAPVTTPGGSLGNAGSANAVANASSPQGLFYTQTPNDQAQILTKLYAIFSPNTTCHFVPNGITEQDALDGKWLTGANAPFGHQVDPTDGVLGCGNENDWLGSLIDLTSYSGKHLDVLAMIADSGLVTRGRSTPVPGYRFKPDAEAKNILKQFFQNELFAGNAIPRSLSSLTYIILMDNFTAAGDKFCQAKPVPSNITSDARKQLAQNNSIVKIQTYDYASKSVSTQEYSYPSGMVNSGVPVGYALAADIRNADNNHDGWLNCGTIAKLLAQSTYANAISDYYAANPNAIAPGGPSGASDISLNCGSDRWAVLANPLNWLMCPIVEGLAGLANVMDNAINRFLTIDVAKTFNDKGPYKQAWATIRNYAIAFIIIAMLIMVLSQALGFEFLDAYTVKKVLPRILLAAIAITLSWELMKFAVSLTNDLGNGIRYIIYKPFSGMTNTVVLGGGGLAIADLIGLGAFAALGPLGLLSFIATAVLAILVAFGVLLLRQFLITLLIILAPLAIISYVLPNTQKVWKLWWDAFSKGLLMFPIIVAFIALGRVMAATITANPSPGPLDSFIAFLAYFAPYFLIPATFKFAGAAIGHVGGFVNDKGRGGFDRLKKYRHGEYQKHGGRRIENTGRRVMTKRLDFNSALQDRASSASASRFSKRAYGLLARTTAGYNLEAGASTKRAQVAKEVNDQIATGIDSEVRGVTVDKTTSARRVENGKTQFQTLGGGWVDEAAVDAGHARWGKDAFAIQAALSYEMRKATTEEQTQSLSDNYHAVAQSLGMSDNQAGGAWIGAAFENQNQHLQYKHTDWQTGQMTESGRRKFVSEIYEKKGSYPLAQMGSNTIVKLQEAYKEAERTGDLDTMNHVKAISETFVNEMGMGMGAQAGMVDDSGTPLPTTPGISGGRRQANTPGAAHVAERVRELADMTGILAASPTGLHEAPTAPDNHYGTRPPNNREQH